LGHVLWRRFVKFAVAGASEGRGNVTGLSWHRGSTRSRQVRRLHVFVANMSPQAPPRRLCASTAGLRRRAKSPGRTSPCFSSPVAGPRDCLIAPIGTAARARAPATAAQSRRLIEPTSLSYNIRDIALRQWQSRVLGCSSPEPDTPHTPRQSTLLRDRERESRLGPLEVAVPVMPRKTARSAPLSASATALRLSVGPR
jgi:hypothetical protein